MVPTFQEQIPMIPTTTHRSKDSAVRRVKALPSVLASVLVLSVVPGPASAADPGLKCEKTAATSLEKCIKKLSKQQSKCYLASGAACDGADQKVAKIFSKTDAKVRKKCTTDAIVRSAGYGPSFSVDGLAERIRVVCSSETQSLMSRTFGGPQGAAVGGADEGALGCMKAAAAPGSKLLTKTLHERTKCVLTERKGKKPCDLTKTNGKLDLTKQKTLTALDAKCGAMLPDLVVVDDQEYLDRADAQSRCATAYTHPNPAPLDLDCGPTSDSFVAAPRGSYVQVVLDDATWGTQCGDGSSYAFQLRLAPLGYPIENVMVAMQGGGVCLSASDCSSVPAGLFEATSDSAPTTGIMSNDPSVSPFANWTKVYLPYCTQDVFFGGGTTSDFSGSGGPVVQRFGAIDMRAAMRYVRDLIWKELDASTTTGYRPDVPRAMLGGFSAGAFGTLYNYHWVLDDLQWAHTTGFPDAGLALDSGGTVSVAKLGTLVLNDTPPYGWGSRDLMPPYCFDDACGVGPVALAAMSPRLKAVPDQQLLILSNQVDSTQVATTFFASAVDWTNAVRQSYCDTKDLPGVQYYLTGISTSVHVISLGTSRYTTYSIGGEVMRDWLGNAISMPDLVVDRAEEGMLTTDIPGVDPFPCTTD
jgi:hypothetical protein